MGLMLEKIILRWKVESEIFGSSFPPFLTTISSPPFLTTILFTNGNEQPTRRPAHGMAWYGMVNGEDDDDDDSTACNSTDGKPAQHNPAAIGRPCLKQVNIRSVLAHHQHHHRLWH